jgi:hypothetical protein
MKQGPEWVAWLRPVSKWYLLDWNYAIRLARFPFLRPASMIIAIMPIVQQFSSYVPIKFENMRLTWLASILFLIGLVVLRLRAPTFILNYQDYEQFRTHGHSQRWIIWEFSNTLRTVGQVVYLAKETREKLLSVQVRSALSFDVYRACPVFPEQHSPTEIYPPRNVNRDIYLPMRIDGHRYVLPFQETDPELEQKEKELFWILLVGCARERPVARTIVWSFFWAAGLTLAYSVFKNIYATVCTEVVPFSGTVWRLG